MTDAYIDSVLLRAQRAMLIISDRIQDNFLYLYSDIYRDLRYKQRDIYILFTNLSDLYTYKSSFSDYNALILVLVSKCEEVDAYNSTYSTINANYQDVSGEFAVTPSGLTLLQTAVVFPGDGISTYIFTELIGNTVLTVYRGTGTTLRVHTSAATNEYAQFNSATGAITVNYAFSAGESLWAEYTAL